ncbi:TPA: hypothetical protein ACHWYJ_005040, partial [Escherichia coli]
LISFKGSVWILEIIVRLAHLSSGPFVCIKKEIYMNKDIEMKDIIFANIEYYSNLWSIILFWSGVLISLFSLETGKTMVIAALVLAGIRAVNNKLSLGRWLG